MRLDSIMLAGALLAVVAFAGCAAPPADPAKKEVMATCERTYRVGSNIPVTVCEEKKTEAEHQQDMDVMRNAIRPNATSGGGKGGD